jgi:hypothetical protein
MSLGTLVRLLPINDSKYIGDIFIGDAVGNAIVFDLSNQSFNTLVGEYILRNATNIGNWNTINGAQACDAATSLGNFNTIYGGAAFGGNRVTSGSSNNTIIGYSAGFSSSTSNSIFVGNGAGYFETENNRLIIDSITRNSEDASKINSIIYGVLDALPSNQYLTINANLGISLTGATSKIDISGVTGYNQLRLRKSFTPTSSGDTSGNIGDFSWDNNYVYVKTNTGWGRTQLNYSF